MHQQIYKCIFDIYLIKGIEVPEIDFIFIKVFISYLLKIYIIFIKEKYLERI